MKSQSEQLRRSAMGQRPGGTGWAGEWVLPLGDPPESGWGECGGVWVLGKFLIGSKGAFGNFQVFINILCLVLGFTFFYITGIDPPLQLVICH